MEQENIVQSAAKLAAHTLATQDINGTPYLLIQDGMQLKDLSHTLSHPTRKTGSIKAQTEKAFVSIYRRYKNDESTVVYADRKHGKFKSVFNDHAAADGKAGHGDFDCEYVCPKSNEWKIWSERNNVRMTQEQFAHFIEQNLVDIVEPNSSEMLQISRELVAKKSANFSSTTRLSDGSHQFHYDEDIKGTTKSGNLEIPETFKIGIPVFLNGTGYEIEARLRYRIKEQHLEMWYELIRPHDVYEDAFNSIFESIEKEIGNEIIEADF